MKNTFKRLLATVIATTLIIGNAPASIISVKAETVEIVETAEIVETVEIDDIQVIDVEGEENRFALDLTAATQGAYNPSTGTTGATKIQGTEFRLTTTYAGDGWRLNPDKTTLPISEEGSNVYDVGGYNSTSNKAPGASVRLHKDYARINFNCGNTIAFYFDAEITDEYVMKMTYYDNSTPQAMDVTVNGQKQHFPTSTTNSVTMQEYAFEMPVTLVAGSTNTLELTEANGTYMEANIKSLTFIKIPFQTITVESAKPVVQELDQDGVQLLVKGISDDGQVVKNFTTEQSGNYEMVFTSLNPEVLRVDENGRCYYVSRGDAQVKVEVIYEGISFESVIDIVSSSQKTGRTLYTDEMVENARYNVANYQWAQNELKKRADGGKIYVDNLEKLYALIPSEGVPRSYENATWNVPDDMKWVCPVCQISFKRTDATYMTDALSEPWKIWCSNCQSRFPSNDFALLYERGLDENGEYNRELAYQRNAEAVARGEKDALVNELYPEKGKTWMVDDGFGWSPTSGTYGTKDMLQYAPIAHYMYKWWHGQKENNITDALVKTRDYYLWTGDEVYGRAGAILLDRVADLYPNYDVAKVSLNYQLSHGGGNSGKIIGSITESKEVVDVFAQCYDAFYPMFDDPEVIAFLSAKAAEKGLENPKTNGNLIRENIENGLLREAFESAKTCKVYGNFGLHQRSITMVAIALDTQPETNKIFEWLNAPSVITKSKIVDPIFGGTYSARSTNSGGELAVKFANDIDRDGFGGEISIDYNYLWYKTLEIAEILENYDTSVIDFFSNPKFINMFESFIHMTGGAGGSRNAGYTFLFGDGGKLGSNKFVTLAPEMVIAYKITKDPLYAQLFHLYNAGNYNNANLGIYNNIAELTASMKNDVATHGEYKFKSLNLTGYGLSIVRGGKAATKYEPLETRYDTWMYYGRTNVSHGHFDMLHMGIDAYGFDFMPDLGYPEATLDNANRYEWIKNTLSHNTVTVNEAWQSGVYTGTPLHYDVTEKVKLIDNECADAYKDITDIYRRSLVTIAANDDVSYTIDFFRVKGGDKHTYSFHSQSYKNFFTEDLALTPQVDVSGEYVGTYAGPNVPYGPDPNSTDAKYAQNPVYPRGYTWLTDVNRGKDKTGDGVFTVDFKQTDWNSQVADSNGLAMKLHTVNDWEPDSVDLMVGYPPRIKENSKIPGFDYMLIQRSGENLDTLFTTVMEPYKVDAYISKVEPIEATIVNGAEGENDISKAIKVTLENNRVDYIIYATNKDVTYHVTDGNVSFDFNGFVGVYTTDYEGNHIYSYVNDGTIIGNMTSAGAYTGTVVDFTKEWTLDDYIIIKADQEIEDLSVLNNQYIYVANAGAKCNGAFRIVSAEKQGENIALYLGNCSLIEGCVDNYNLGAGYLYSIANGQAFRIPVSSATAVPTPEATPSPILFLDLTEATEGAYNPGDGTSGATYVQGIEFQLTTAYAGEGWRLNAEKTTLPLMDEGSGIYARGTYSSDTTKEPGASVRLHKDYQRINFNYGNTIAFDFDVEVAGEYQMIMSYYDNSTPEKMSVTVNGVTQNVPKRTTDNGYNTGTMREWVFEIPITLVAGSANTLEFTETNGNYMETNVASIRFVKSSTEKEYTVTWTNFDGTVLATETYKNGEMPEYKGETPVYNNYTFVGWSPEVSAVEGDITYTAQFEMSGKSIEWFDEDGDGVAETGYYYVDGAVKKGAGLVEVDGYLYWVLSTGKIAVGTTRTIKANQTNGLIEAGTYYFLNNGVLETQEVRLSGEIRWVEEGGKQVGYYYVMDEVRKDVGLVEVWNEEAGEDTWYYVLFSGKVKRNYVADGKRVNQTVKAAKLNKYTGPEGLYSFYEDGVMYDPYATETGIVKYDETGKPWYYVDGHIRKDAGLVYVQRGDLAGNYIFVTFSGTLKKGTQSIKDKTCNGHTEFIGTQRFDSNTGAMIIK